MGDFGQSGFGCFASAGGVRGEVESGFGGRGVPTSADSAAPRGGGLSVAAGTPRSV